MSILLTAPMPFTDFRFLDMDFYTMTCAMLIYAFIGWFYESTIFSLIEQGKFMNRGCFIGPYCPIYAVAPLMGMYFLQGIDSSFKIVVMSGLLVCAVEYVTSYVLEKLFNARYWDYSYFPLNINGRVSVVSGLFFGFAVLLFIKLLHPFVFTRLSHLPIMVRYYAAIFIWGFFILDAVFTTVSMMNLNKKCKQLYDAWDNYVESGLEKLNNKKDELDRFVIVQKGKNLIVKLKGVNTTFVALETRYLKSFPDFYSTKYNGLIKRMKSAMKIKVVHRLEDYDKEYDKMNPVNKDDIFDFGDENISDAPKEES